RGSSPTGLPTRARCGRPTDSSRTPGYPRLRRRPRPRRGLVDTRTGQRKVGPAAVSVGWLSLTAELGREVLEVLGDHVPLAGGGDVAGLAGAVLVGARDERGLQADRAGGGEVSVVGGDHQA